MTVTIHTSRSPITRNVLMKFTMSSSMPVALVFAMAIATIFGSALRGQDAPPAKSDAQAATQEPAAEPTETTPPAADKSLDELLTEWSDMDKRLKDAESAAQADEAPESARKTYVDLVDEAYKLIDTIQTAAIAAITKDPQDERASKTLVGIMVNASNKADSDGNVLALADQLFVAGATPELFSAALTSSRLSPFGKDLFDEILIRQKEHQANDLPQVKLTTSKGEIILELFENQAPNSVANFISLVKAKYYDGLKFHRVIEGFMAQGGCPKGDGSGGPEYNIKCECYEPNFRKHFAGTLSMAHAGRDTGGSQFFITFRATSFLDGKHTVFGRVISGLDVLDQLTRNHTEVGPIPGIEADTIVSAEVVRDRGHEYVPTKINEKPASSDPAK